jgi:integrase
MLNVAVRKKLLPANPCAGVEFPVRVKGLFRPHYVTWSEQRTIEAHAPEYLRNIVRIISETGLRVYKELMPMKKEQLDIANAMVWIPDSKTPNGVAEVPLTPLALEAFRDQMRLSPCSPYLFPTRAQDEHIKNLPVGQMEILMTDQLRGTLHSHLHVRRPRNYRFPGFDPRIYPRLYSPSHLDGANLRFKDRDLAQRNSHLSVRTGRLQWM